VKIDTRHLDAVEMLLNGESQRVTAKAVGVDSRTIRGWLKDEDFLKVISLLLGLPIDTVAEAPLEDTMNAVADAFSINDMPALLKAATHIWQEIQSLGAKL